MDIYLPAEFRELHAAAPDDWRDLPSACTPRDDRTRRDAQIPDAAGADPDPLWRVI